MKKNIFNLLSLSFLVVAVLAQNSQACEHLSQGNSNNDEDCKVVIQQLFDQGTKPDETEIKQKFLKHMLMV